MLNITEEPCHDIKYKPKKTAEANPLTHKQNCKEKIPTITCVCGAHILVVPDLKEMNRVIEKHVAQHKKAGNCEGAQCWALDDLRQCLIEQLLNAASDVEA